MAVRRFSAILAVASLAGAGAAFAQGQIRGVAYDSLLRQPLAGAEVEVRGTTRRAVADRGGHFRLDSVPAGRQIVVLSHPGLDSTGLFTLAGAVMVEPERVATIKLATPSLQTVWRRRCGAAYVAGADSGVVFGVIADAASGNRLAGAAVVAGWLDLRQVGERQASAQQRTTAALSDSIGAYAVCGTGTDATVYARAYGAGDSTGAIEILPGGRPVARRDFTIGRTVQGAALRGFVRGDGGLPIVGARLSVDSATTSTNESGAFMLTGLPAGTQWLTVRSVARAPTGMAVDLRDGDTAAVDLNLGALAIMLDTVRVEAARLTATLLEIEERRRSGAGLFRDEKDLIGRPDIVTALQGFPSVRAIRNRGSFSVILPPRTARESGCVGAVYIDGIRGSYDELLLYRPEEIRAIEVFPRANTAPARYPSRNGCGVLLIWTKYLQ